MGGRPQLRLNFGALSQKQSVFDIDPEIPNGVLDLGVTQQYLNCTNVARGSVDHRGFRPAKRVRAVLGFPQADNPLSFSSASIGHEENGRG